ncbi:hypothetical protein Q3G72_025650 [Acer saccharum]|nr:hypothetical protein Q3G72_025650 [Acer saccharum]
MHIKQAGDRSDEAKADFGYVETDPSGRYGRLEEVLGKGAMKTVYKAIDEVFGVEVAWNQVKLNEVMRKTFNFITEMFTSGTLREYRKKYQRVDIRAIKSWSRQVLQGLVYLHEHDPPVIHRDLKCDNIFVNGHLGQVKIGDLGLAAILTGSKSAHSVIGTPEFMAPELYEEDYNELVDVYSFGMCLLEMLTLEYPYSECTNPAQIYKKVTSGKLPGAFYKIQDLEAQRFIGKCLVNASKRLSAKELLLDPFLASDHEAKLLSKAKLNPNPFLNEKEMENLHLSDDQDHDHTSRTDMTITGKLNPEDDTIFLKVQIADKDGSVRNVYFPFDIVNDTALDVATEMVKELELADWEPSEIAEMIDGEISAIVPHWKKLNLPHSEANYHTFNYQEDDDHDRPLCSFSSSSSSQVSLSGLLTHGYDWQKDDLYDDSSSQSSSHSGTYSNLNYFSGDEYKPDMSPTARTHHQNYSTRFCPEEMSYRQCKILLDSHGASSSKSTPKRVMNSHRTLTRNRSLVDVRSQLLHRSLVEEVNKRRLSKTVGAVENIGFQAPCEVLKSGSRKTSRHKNSKS